MRLAPFSLPYDHPVKPPPPRTRGQSLSEYALIVALIVIVALVALTLFGTQIEDVLSVIAEQINS